MKHPGIYAIINKVNGKRYIGSAKDIRFRKWLHLTSLRSNKHYNSLLQRSWNKYGESNFEFCVVLLCRISDLLMYEQAAIDAFLTFDKKNGFNLAPVAGSPLGIKRSAETKRKISEKKKGQPSWNKGRKLSTEHKALLLSFRLGSTPWNKGKPWGEETKAKFRAAKLGTKHGPYKTGNILKTHCPQGHPYAGDNLIVRDNRRHCRTCRRLGKKRCKKQLLLFSCESS